MIINQVGAPGSLARAEQDGYIIPGYSADFQRMRNALEEIRRTVSLWVAADNMAGRVDAIARQGLGERD